jgi:hypothetical protein
MGWTKREFVVQAFEEIGYASYVYDLQPEQLELALRRLDSMVATWNSKGIRLGYPMPANPGESSLDDDTEVPDYANEAIYVNLAVRIAGTVGKTLSPDTRINGAQLYKSLLREAARPMKMQLPSTMPSGAGNKGWRYDDAFLNEPSDPLLAGDDGPIEFS